MIHLKNISDSDKLRIVADYFDKRDESEGNTCHDVQNDLRRIADKLDKLETLSDRL